MYSNLQPIVAILTGWVALSEAPTAWQIAGTASIIGGLLLTRASAPAPTLANATSSSL
jgi:drug/metabolite transporter (DMT)-like permease